MQWFKFYTEALNDPKVDCLPDALYKGCVKLLCLANQSGGRLPPIAGIAYALRLEMHAADRLVTTLVDAGLIDDVGGHMEPHNWHERQGSKDRTAADRMRKYRERKGGARNVTAPLRVTGDVTPVTVTALDKNRVEKKRVEKGARKRAAHTIPEGFPSEVEIRWTLKEHPRLSAWGEAEKFRDYALQHGKQYSDWAAAWRTWCRNSTRWATESNNGRRTA